MENLTTAQIVLLTEVIKLIGNSSATANEKSTILKLFEELTKLK